MENEKIYVVVPVYKVEPYLERCVESILNQTYDNYDLILVDDGSPDNCPAICDRYAEKYDRITVIHQENGGLSAARNTGIEYALEHGNPEKDWINFIDSDDFVHPRYLEYLYRAAKEAGTDISSCGFVRTDATEVDSADIGELKYMCISPETYWCKNFTNANVACGKLYRSFLFENIRYPIGKIYEDNFTTYKLLFQYPKIAVMWTRLYYWYINPNSITTSVWAPNRIDQLDAFETQIAFFLENGYTAAYTPTVKALYEQCVLHIRFIHGQAPRYNYLLDEMRKRQRRTFTLFAKEYGTGKAISVWLEIRLVRPVKRILRNKSVFSFLKRKLKKLTKF